MVLVLVSTTYLFFVHSQIITWVIKAREVPELPEPVRLRVCPEMPCRLTTNRMEYQQKSAALIWNAQIMREGPPRRSHPDQVGIIDL